MSAIAAFCDRTQPADHDKVQSMLATAPHRGREHLIDSLGPFALGVARDPDWPRASLFRSDRLLAVLAGRLDNLSYLSQQLDRPQSAESNKVEAAEILLAVFQKWGPKGVDRLRGSFTGFITDGRSLWAFRDHFGTRPLYYSDHAGRFAAASEIKQVLAVAEVPAEPNTRYLQWLIFGGRDLADTAYRHVRRIQKRTVVEISSESSEARKTEYWDPSPIVATAKLDLNEAIDGLREALQTAVSRAMSGEDAILLSGGLDSPALAAFAAKGPYPSRPIQAATSVYPDYPSVDESKWTRLVADYLGIELHEFVAQASNLDDLEYWLRLTDGPIDLLSIPESAEAYRFCRSLGARTVLTGEMAEVVFESRGYLLDHLVASGQWRQAIRLLGGPRKTLRQSGWLGRELVRMCAPPAWVLAYRERNRRRHPHPGIPKWIDQGHFSYDGAVFYDTFPTRQRWVEVQTGWLRGPSVGVDADEVCASVCGVEVRRPFSDVDLFEYVLTLPASVKFHGPRHKPLLRTAMRGLIPDAIVDRKDKTLFNEYLLAKAEYPTLRKTLVGSRHQVEGIDYALLSSRIESGNLSIGELQWARDLARIHAFLDQW